MQIGKLAIQMARHLIFPPQMKIDTSLLDFQSGLIKANLKKYVEELSSIPRFTQNIKGLNQGADYIKRILENDIKLPVEELKYLGPPGDPNIYRNLIVSFGPENAPRIILGAHYDSYYNRKKRIYTPGADDNASGVAGILEISRLLKELKPRLKHRMDVVAYPNEERPHCGLDIGETEHEKYVPYMGSFVHAQSLKDKNIPVIGAIIPEMIGYYSDEKDSQTYPINILKLFYPTKGNFIGVLGNLDSFELIQKVRAGIKQNSSIDVRSLSISPKILPDIARSDHDCYYMHGNKGLMINNTSEYRTPHYHEVTDTPDTLDYDKMTEVVKGIFATVIKL